MFNHFSTIRAEKKGRAIGSAFCMILTVLVVPVVLFAGDTAVVKYVIDGDTVILKNGDDVRYIGIDAPEIDHENNRAELMGYEARSLNKALVGSKDVRLEYDHETRDHYGRRLAYVFLKNGTFVNRRLVRAGLATYLHKPPNLNYAENLLKAQQTAMSSKMGVWRTWSERSQSYLGNRKSKRFHLPGCPYGTKTAPANRVLFSRQWDAYWEGYAPCAKCLK